MAEKPTVPPAEETKDRSKGGESLEDLMTSLHKQIKGSDWLKQNTAEKWQEEHKEIATEFTKNKESQEEKPAS